MSTSPDILIDCAKYETIIIYQYYNSEPNFQGGVKKGLYLKSVL